MSSIKRNESFVEMDGKVASSKWFIPNTVPMDEKILQDYGETFWSRNIMCSNRLTVPGGMFVTVHAITHNAGPYADRVLQAFGEFVDMTLEVFRPDDPFESLQTINRELERRWPEAHGWANTY